MVKRPDFCDLIKKQGWTDQLIQLLRVRESSAGGEDAADPETSASTALGLAPSSEVEENLAAATEKYALYDSLFRLCHPEDVGDVWPSVDDCDAADSDDED